MPEDVLLKHSPSFSAEGLEHTNGFPLALKAKLTLG